MIKPRLKKGAYVLAMVVFTLGLSISVQSIYAVWTAPTAIAPGDNTTTPLNVSSIGQLKKAGLVINGGALGEITQNGLIVSYGNSGFGTLDPRVRLDVNGEGRFGNSGIACSADIAGSIRYSGSNNRMYYCNGTVWKLFSTDIPYNQFVTYNNEADYYQEDLKQSCVKFVVDTANTSGHFTNTGGTAQTVGSGNNCSKVVVGTRFQINTDWFNIISIIGNGSANNGILFTGTKSAGTYPVNYVYATQFDNGVVKLNGEGSLYGDGSYSGNVVQGGSTIQPQDYYPEIDRTAGTIVTNFDGWGGPSSNAYDGNLNNVTGYTGVSPNGVYTRYMGKMFASPVVVSKAWADSGNTTSFLGASATEVKLIWSDDGATWSDASAAVPTVAGVHAQATLISNVATPHKYWALTIKGNGVNSTYVGELKFYGAVLYNTIVVTGVATVAPEPTTGASVVMAENIVIDGSSASLKPSTNSKGLVIYAKSGVKLLNGASLNIDKLGKAGVLGDTTAYDLTPTSLRSKVNQIALGAYVVSGVGASGGVGGSSGISSPGSAGASAVNGSMKSGGGGGGGGGSGAGSCFMNGARGGKGGTLCGGGGGGGGNHSAGGAYSNPSVVPDGGVGGNGGAFGAASGYCSAGGAGDPPGATSPVTCASPVGAGGGFLAVFSPSVSVSAGSIISSDGAQGGNACPYIDYDDGGGGAGGGVVLIVTNVGGYSNNGTVRANGGAGGTSRQGPGGAGGSGSINTFTSTGIGGIPTNVYTTVITSVSLDSSGWSGISPATIAENLNSGKSFYSISFDNKNSFNVYNSGWRVIASNKNSDHGGINGDWYYRDNANNWIAAYDNSANAAISQAMGAGTNNQMSGSAMSSISGPNWVATGGFTAGQQFFDVATTLYSTGSANNPAVDQITLIVN